MGGNGPHHHGPCRYACTGQPAPYTKGSLLEVWAAHPPTMRHHRLPMQGAQDGKCHPHSARTRHRAHQSSPPHAIAWCTAAWRGIGCHRQLQSFHLPSTASLFGRRYKKVHLTQTVMQSSIFSL